MSQSAPEYAALLDVVQAGGHVVSCFLTVYQEVE